ncbi:MAG: hypothetical protein KJ626_00745 [Verrucomicrobia bacterium]|nr:hypothetical protein [Verrucomicrobiota bacterium]
MTIGEYDSAREKSWEAVFCEANGYLGIRGYPIEGAPGMERVPSTYSEGPGTLPQQYVAAVFDGSPVTGKTMVNLPTWRLTYIHLGGEKLDLSSGRVDDYMRRLDMRGGTVCRAFIWTSSQGRRTRLSFKSFLSWERRHVLASRIEVTALNWSGDIRLSPTFDGAGCTLRHHHFQTVDEGETASGLRMSVRTAESDIIVSMARSIHSNALEPGEMRTDKLLLQRDYNGMLSEGETLAIDEFCAVCTSVDVPDNHQPADRSLAILKEAESLGFDALLKEQADSWAARWRDSDVVVESDERVLQKRLRFYIYQMLQSFRGDDPRLSIGAKMLSGQHYSGHYFWDTEIFLLPFFIFTRPEEARCLLQHRTRNLAGARTKARELGFCGAFYPWEGDPLSGGENCPKWWADESSEKAVRILCGEIELHVNAAVVFGLEHYHRATGDDAFWSSEAGPVVVECARFWASRGEWDGRQFVIRDVIGPDEYHEHVDNDCYTNHLARWTLRLAAGISDCEGVTAEERDEWLRMADAMKDQYLAEAHLLAQDDEYLSLKGENEPDTRGDKPLYVKFSPDELTRMRFVKQASIIALFHLFPKAYDRELMRNCWDYYVPRTVHDSNLSAGSHSYVAARLDLQDEAVRFYESVLNTDLGDGQGNVGEGIHAANAGNAWMVAVMGFGGIYADENRLYIDPRLPGGWSRLAFPLYYRGRRLEVEVTPARLNVRATSGPSINLLLAGEEVNLGGHCREVGKDLK